MKDILKILRLEGAVSRIQGLSRQEERYLPVILASGKNDLDPNLKLRIYRILHELRGRTKKPFGTLVVLGWRREWNRVHASIPDIDQNLFKENHFDLGGRPYGDSYEAIKKTVDFDGAVIISAEGIILGSGVYLENVRSKEIAKIIHPGSTEDLSTAFGFARKVHTRHLAAIAASYVLKNTSIFVVSEEDRSLRVFESGRIVWSTIPSEIHRIIESEIE